jgi:hypothetical protein
VKAAQVNYCAQSSDFIIQLNTILMLYSLTLWRQQLSSVTVANEMRRKNVNLALPCDIFLNEGCITCAANPV